MKITSIDLFYISLPVIREIADGSQDSLLCRVTADTGLEGWGEADSSPLVSISVYVMPMSHSNIISIKKALLGQEVNSADCVRKLRDRAARLAMDVEQFNHAYPAVDIALWDLLGKHKGLPVYKLLGYEKSHPKIAYASVLFGNTPEETEAVAKKLASEGFRAAKFGWGPFGSKDLAFDVELVKAARRGLGPDAMLFVDAGVVFGSDVHRAFERMRAIASERVGWFEEPFRTYEIDSYRQLKEMNPPIKIAAGEGAASLHAGMEMMVRGKLDFIQIDVGRIGGITVADAICRAARDHRCHYVNHTYKSQLLLAASLHVFAGAPEFNILEYAAGESVLITGVTSPTGVKVDEKGMCQASDLPGLGVEVNKDFVRKHLKRVIIQVDGHTVYETPAL